MMGSGGMSLAVVLASRVTATGQFVDARNNAKMEKVRV